jgi:hypothetical protein
MPPFIARKMAGIRFPSEHAVKYGAGEWQPLMTPRSMSSNSGSAVFRGNGSSLLGAGRVSIRLRLPRYCLYGSGDSGLFHQEYNFLDATSWLAVRFKRRLRAL